jgi:hypothetical protein
MAQPIPFAEWRPDMPDLGQWAREALNVIPAEESYRPLPSFSGVSNALTARAQGAAWFRGTGGAVKMFAGDATKLYLLSGTTWTSVPQLAAAKVITAITKANPGAVTTSTAHGYSNGDTIYISGVVGMTQVNNLFFTVTSTGANTFTIGVDTSAYTIYGSAGTAQKATIYAPGPQGRWRFTQYGYNAFAVNGIDPPQKFDLASGTNWVAMGGSPPVGTYIATVKDFVVMGNIGATPQRVQWSPINSPEGTWGSIAATQADIQDVSDGGNITGLVGGEIGVILQEAAVRRMSYVGAPVVFRIDKIGNEVGCSVPNSVASLLDLCFFLHKSGFYMLQGGQTFTPIGRGKVDKTFWAEFDETNMDRCSAAIDPVRSLYIFNYPASGNGGTPNKQLIYNWGTNKWSHANVTNELIFSGVSQQSYTLEQLDPFGTLETLPYSLDSSFWSGAVSLLLYAFDTTHKSGSFSGANLAATIDTAEFNPGGGKRTVVRSCRPLVDGGSPQIQVGSREIQQGAVAFSVAAGLTPAGMAPLYKSGRYHRFRLTMPAGATWSNAMAIDDVDVRPMGMQ